MTEKNSDAIKNVLLVAIFVGAAIYFRTIGEMMLAGECLAGALALAVPTFAGRRLPGGAATVLIIALIGGSLLSGCDASGNVDLNAIKRYGCTAACVTCRACQMTSSGGESAPTVGDSEDSQDE